MKNWLDNYNDVKISAPEGYVGEGTSNKGRNYSPAWGGQFQKGGQVKYGTPEYEEAYNKGEVITKEGVHSPIKLDEVIVKGKKKDKNWLEQYADKITEENKDAGLLGAIIGTPISAVTSLPQLLGMKALTGEMERPSESLDIKNPYGAMAVDAIVDPANLIGAGLLTKEKALARLTESTESGILSNAHKYNPLAFKPEQGKYYRQVFGEDIEPLVTRSMKKNNDKKGVNAFLEANQDVIYTNKGEKMLDVHNFKTKESLPYFNKNEPFYPRSRAGVNETLIENKLSLEDYQDFYPSKIKSMSLDPTQVEAANQMFGNIRTLSPFSETGHNLDNYNVYQKHWLKGYKKIPKQKNGGITKDDLGYWNPDNWGKPVEIGSNDITMEGVDQDLIGISDEGDVQYMTPGNNYKFKGKKVTEFPIAKNGKELDQLTNFTNYNTKQSGGWLDIL